MKIVKITYLTILFACSCSKEKNNQSYSYIDQDTDSTFYKMDVCESDEYLQSQEGDWKETVLLTNAIYVKDSCFGGLSNIPAAVTYAKSINVEKPHDCITRTAISIKGSKGEFHEVWRIDRNFYWPDGEFGEYAGKIEVDEGYYKIGGKNYKGIRIIEKINNEDLSLKFLNYIYESKKWQLISREHITTKASDKGYVYCKDSLNANIHQDDKLPIYVNNQMFYDLSQTKCR